MSERVERLQRALAAYNETGEISTEGIPRDFELHQASSIIDSRGVFRGPEALAASLQELAGSFGELTFDAEEVLEAPGGEAVMLIRVRGRGRGSDMQVDNRIAWVWTFRGDEPVRLTVYEERADALAAVGLEPA